MASKKLLIISGIGALGGFLFGYDTAVISGTVGFLEAKFNLNSTMTGFAVSSAILGCLIGAAIAGVLADRYGRKITLIITAFLFLISAIGCSFAFNYSQLVLFRIIGGVGVGAASVVSPMYLSEISPADKRGKLVSLYQLAIVLGINMAYIFNYFIARYNLEVWNIDHGWRYMLGSESIPALAFLVFLFFVPESPRWLFASGSKDKSLEILKLFNTEENANSILEEIKNALSQKKGTLKDVFFKNARIPLVIGIGLAIFSQITGINAVMYYAPKILSEIGFSVNSSLMQTVLIGIINTIFTFVAIKYIDKLGRKSLLIVGTIAMIICLFFSGLLYNLGLGSSPWMLVCILGFVASYASSVGPVFWVLISEIFPNKIRSIAMAIIIIILWISTMFISQFTPLFLERLGVGYTFWSFMLSSILLLFFVIKMVSETKGKSLEEISKSWS